MNTLNQAIEFATRRHDGQVDKSGKPYIFHCLRVMMAVAHLGEEYAIVGVLHDVIEDTGTASSYMVPYFGHGVTDVVCVLTRKPTGESYETYIERVAKNPRAVKVKLADLRDNLGRLGNLSEADQARLRPKYEAAIKRLSHVSDREPTEEEKKTGMELAAMAHERKMPSAELISKIAEEIDHHFEKESKQWRGWPGWGTMRAKEVIQGVLQKNIPGLSRLLGAASVQQEPLSAAHPDQSWEYKASFRIAQVLNKSTAHYDVLNIMNIFHDFRVKEELKTYPAAPRTQGREEKIFKGWIAFGCGKHPRNSIGANAYKIDCLDCQKQPMVAWFEGEQPISPLAQARTQPSRPYEEGLFERLKDPVYAAHYTAECVKLGIAARTQPSPRTDFKKDETGQWYEVCGVNLRPVHAEVVPSEFFTALPEATNPGLRDIKNGVFSDGKPPLRTQIWNAAIRRAAEIASAVPSQADGGNKEMQIEAILGLCEPE